MDRERDHRGDQRIPGAGARPRDHLVALGLFMAALPPAIACMRSVGLWLDGHSWFPLADGLNIWSGAHLALNGQLATLFNPVAYGEWFHAHFGGDLHTWSYPPDYLLAVLPFGLLPPAVAVLSFDLLSLLILLVALRACGFDARFTAAVLLSPAALANLYDNTNGALFAALLIAGLFLAEKRPYVAGVLIGLVTMKPQLGVLIPVFWLARGNWRGILAAALTSVSLVIASASAFGWTSWTMFATRVMPFMSRVLVQLTAKPHHGPRAMIMSVFSLAQQLGLGFHVATALQATTTIAALALAAVLGRTRAAPVPCIIAALLLLTTLATPYIWYYDMIPASFAVALLARDGLTTGFRPGELAVYACLWITPGIAPEMAMRGLPSFAPVFVVLSLVYLWRRTAAFTSVASGIGRPGPALD